QYAGGWNWSFSGKGEVDWEVPLDQEDTGGSGLSRHSREVAPTAPAHATLPAVVFVRRAGLISRRWRSPDSAFANLPASSAAGHFGTPACHKLAAALPLARRAGNTRGS